MGDHPTAAIKSKPRSSIVMGNKLVREGKADAFVGAGNTGAMMAAATLIMGRIPGVGRPTIGAMMPAEIPPCMLFDVGASVDSKPKHLLEYALMGSIYIREMYGIENPRLVSFVLEKKIPKEMNSLLLLLILLKNKAKLQREC